MLKHVTTPRNNAEGGFTLIEIAAVTIIIGLLVGAFAPLYMQHVKKARQDQTQEAITNLSLALGDFRNLYGHYPCPARTDVGRNSPEYGRTTDCRDTSQGVGCAGGICIQDAIPARLVDMNPDESVTDMQRPRIRVGAIPFRQLNLMEEDVLDGFGNPLTYAVTEHLAASDVMFDENGGGVHIVQMSDDGEQEAVTPAGSAHFILISHGDDGEGAIIPGTGVRRACQAGTLQNTNCTIGDEAVYRTAQRSTANNANRFDDVVSFFTPAQISHWKTRSPDEVVAAGTVPPIYQMDLNKRVAINGTDSTVMLAGADVVEGTLRTSENLQTQNICEFSGSTNCFASDLIAGALADGGGLACPDGQYMVGIQFSTPICADEVISSCPSGQMVTGVDSNGQLICNSEPVNCPTTSVSICPGTTQVLPSRRHDPNTPSNNDVFVHGGDSRSQRYRCMASGVWESQGSPSGVCTCTPQPNQVYTVQWWEEYGCGPGYRGNVYAEREYICPAGEWGEWFEAGRDCTCEPSNWSWTEPCPENFDGEVTVSLGTTCDANGVMGWTEETRVSNCVCNNGQVRTRSIQCSTRFPGFTGTIEQSSTLSCPAGEYSTWTDTGNNCACEPRTETREAECPAGQIGTIQQERAFTCTASSGTWGEWQEISNDCRTPPPVVCRWVNNGSGNTGSAPIGEDLGSADCECGESGPCNAPAGNVYVNYGSCTCR